MAVACVLPATSLGAVLTRTHGALSPVLSNLAKPSVRSMGPLRQARILGVAAAGPGSLIRRGNRVVVDVRFFRGAVAALPELRDEGAGVVASSRRYQRVTLSVPPAALRRIASVDGVASVSPVRAPVLRLFDPCEGGLVVSEGVTQLNVKDAREEFEVEGGGVTVGVLSDSLNQANEAVSGGVIATKLPEDVRSKELPGPTSGCPGQETAVNDLKDYFLLPGEEDPFDEGRAMLQIVHDVAPEADLAFHSAFNGETDFAEGIEELAAAAPEGAGAQVIVDDVGYFEEPFFQDGPVAAAVNKVTEEGVTYLSAAGNDNLFDEDDNEIASWEALEYRDSGSCPGAVRPLPGFNASHCLDFNPATPIDRTFGIRVEPEETLSVDLQWAEPWYGVETDLDAFLLDATGELLTASFSENEGTQRPVEIVQWTNESNSEKTVQLVVNRFSGAADPRLKFILLQNGGGVKATEYPKSGGEDVVGPTIYGHAGAAAAIAAAAVRYSAGISTANAPEEYSSRGPVTHYFAPVESNVPSPPISKDVISKPDLAATDCGETTFFARVLDPKTEPGVWRFCGTSAAAPHAAGVAALMLESEPAAIPEEVQAAISGSGTAVGPGTCAGGGGLVEAVGALEAIKGGPFTALEPCNPPDALGQVFVAPGDWGSEEPPMPPVPPANPAPPAPQPTPVPPTTRFAKHPPKVVRTRSNTVRIVFGFGSDQAGVGFLCKIDGTAFRACGAQIAHRFGLGKHVVKIKAQTAAGLADPTPAVFQFQVRRSA
jgi:subtilisin family serine protease